jgi:TATA-binding protein-associated factor Taf7
MENHYMPELLKERLADLEAEVERLKHKVDQATAPQPW